MTTSPCWPPRPAQQPTARALLPAWGAAGRMTARHLCHVRVQRLCWALALPWRAATRTRLLACRRPLRACVAAGLARARRRRRAKLSRRRVQRLQQRGRAALGQMHAAQRAALRAAGRVRRGEGLCCELFGSGEGLSGGITRNDHLAMSAQRVSPADLNLCMFHMISHLLTSSPSECSRLHVAFCEGGSARDWWATEAWGRHHKLHDQRLTSRQSSTCTYMSLNARAFQSPRAPPGPEGPPYARVPPTAPRLLADGLYVYM